MSSFLVVNTFFFQIITFAFTMSLSIVKKKTVFILKLMIILFIINFDKSNILWY